MLILMKMISSRKLELMEDSGIGLCQCKREGPELQATGESQRSSPEFPALPLVTVILQATCTGLLADLYAEYISQILSA